MARKKTVDTKRLTAKPSKQANVFNDVKKAVRTADGFDNFLSRLGLNNDNALSAGTYEFNLVTRNRVLLEAAYRGSWIVGAVVDSIPEDMTRAGIDMTTADSEQDLKPLQAEISRLKIAESLCTALKWGDLYGGSIGVFQIKGQKLETPLDLETIAEGQFQGIAVYDRWQVNPDMTTCIEEGPDMGLPKFYDIVTGLTSSSPAVKTTSTGQIRVHHSRVIRQIGIQLPFFQAITEMMWGESKLERLWDRLISFDNATLSSASLIDRANLRTVSIDGLREIIAAGGQAYEGLVAFFDLMRSMQVNEGLTLLDKEDTFAATAYSFAGLSDMMLQFGQQLAGASQIPLVRLFGQSPAGLSATGESDMRMYYDSINAKQEAKLRNAWDVLLHILWRSVYGEAAPDDLEFTFTPLWQMSNTDKVNNAKTAAESIIGAYEAGLTKKETALKELRDSSSETGIFANITDDEILEAKELDDEPPMPGEIDPALDPAAPDPKVEPSNKPVKSLGDSKWKRWFRLK